MKDTKRERINKERDKLEKEKKAKMDKFLISLFPAIRITNISNFPFHDDDTIDLTVNGKKVVIDIDEYNNVSLLKSSKLEIDELKAIHEVLVEYLENEGGHKYRSGTSFLIDYVRHIKTTKKFRDEMIHINQPIEKNNDGLKCWMRVYPDRIGESVKG